MTLDSALFLIVGGKDTGIMLPPFAVDAIMKSKLYPVKKAGMPLSRQPHQPLQ
jgi:hypothetical protein